MVPEEGAVHKIDHACCKKNAKEELCIRRICFSLGAARMARMKKSKKMASSTKSAFLTGYNRPEDLDPRTALEGVIQGFEDGSV